MATKRISGRRLQRIRRRILSDQPLCVRCEAQGRVREAVQVDHRDPLHKDGAEDDDNRQALCLECHATKTREDMGHKPLRKIGPDGYPL